MSPSPSETPPSPTAAQTDDARFPQGQCRYIFITPGLLKGQRCACVAFNHNKAMPGATCDCGHLSCFHVTSADEPSPGRNQTEIEYLKKRVQLLEETADRGEHGRVDGVVARVSQLEEWLDKSREEIQAEIKDSYRNISGAWQLVEQMQRRMTAFEESYRVQNLQLERAGKELRDLRNRQLELADSDESLEERIEKLEAAEVVLSPQREVQRRDSELETSSPTTTSDVLASRPRRASASRATTHDVVPLQLSEKADASQPEPPPAPGAWTVHVSLLPSREQPFPFEKDTNAYKRCLSRGLHRMVAVEGQDAQAFVTAVSRSFESVLQGRSWEPLQAKLCDAEKLQGLPMLRPLDASLLDGNYDVDFLRRHCAVRDGNGRIESLYVALRHDTMSWDFLRGSPVFVEGLASSWDYVPALDGRDGREVSGHGAGDAMASTSCLKRGASDMSQAGPTGNESEGSRNKVSRACMPGMVEMRRGVGTAL